MPNVHCLNQRCTYNAGNNCFNGDVTINEDGECVDSEEEDNEELDDNISL